MRTSAGKNARPLDAAERPGSLKSTCHGRPEVVLKEEGMLMRTMLTEEKEGIRVKPVNAIIVRDGP